MLIIDFEATRKRVKERCINLAGVAHKYELNPRSMHMFVLGKFSGKSGQGVYGRCENALIDMGLLVFTVQREEKPRKAA